MEAVEREAGRYVGCSRSFDIQREREREKQRTTRREARLHRYSPFLPPSLLVSLLLLSQLQRDDKAVLTVRSSRSHSCIEASNARFDTALKYWCPHLDAQGELSLERGNQVVVEQQQQQQQQWW